ALIPQFVVPGPDAGLQAMVLGATFMALATVLDGGYALAAGQAGAMLTQTRVRMVERVSGLCLIGGGLWLAFSRRA
ncbi:MAG: LysE family translocator, partial [Pseudomonadota bacterium]